MPPAGAQKGRGRRRRAELWPGRRGLAARNLSASRYEEMWFMLYLVDEYFSDPAQSRDAMRAARGVYRGAGLVDYDVELLLTDDAAIRALNLRWRQKAKATDVLSFAAMDGAWMPELPEIRPSLGDIVISVDTAARQALRYGHTLQEELAVLVAHGLLHLLGLDHERSPAEALRQAECEMTLLAAAGVAPGLALSGRAFG